MSVTVWIILAAGFATWLTRIGGDLVLSRFERVHPRVEAALDAVPAAVLTTLFVPAATTGGIPEWAALVVSGALFLRSSNIMIGFVAGAAVLIALRNLLG
jgi:uncharacterized membrane protein